MKKKLKVLLSSIPFIIASVLFLYLYLNTALINSNSINIEVLKGKATLPSNSDEKIFLISGEFYFTANQFNKLKKTNKETYAILPGSFYQSPLNSKFGYASYGLHLEGLNPNLIYSLRLSHALSACSVVINDNIIGQQGKVGTSYDDEEPGTSSSEVTFRSNKNGSIDIIFNISNFVNRKGGFFSKMILSEVNMASKMFRRALIFNAGIFISIFSISIFLFLLFFFYKQVPFVIWFALASIVIAIRGTFFYPHIVSHLFLSMNWKIGFIMRYITFPLTVLFMTVCLKKALKVCYKIPYFVIVSVSIIHVISILVLPQKISGDILIYYQIFTIFTLIYSMLILSIALVKRKEFARWIFTAIMILIGISGYDLLVAMGVFDGLYFIHIGSFFSIVLLSIMILKIYADSIEKIDDLNFEMKNTNNSLVRFVPKEIMRLLNKNSIKEIKIGDNIELKMPILSMDIRSFTNKSEKLSTQNIVGLLNEYFALLVPIVREYDGIIPKYLGDGCFVLFPKGPSYAVECAIKIQEMLKACCVNLAGESKLRIGIGIDYGDVLFGTIGSSKRMDSIIISSSYRNAENLQTFTKKYNSSIIISSSVFHSLEEEKQKYIRPIQLLKGKKRHENLLYEVYEADDDKTRELKNKTQNFLKNAFKAIASYNVEEAYGYFNKAFSSFPDDPVSKSYIKLFLNNKKA